MAPWSPAPIKPLTGRLPSQLLASYQTIWEALMEIAEKSSTSTKHFLNCQEHIFYSISLDRSTPKNRERNAKFIGILCDGSIHPLVLYEILAHCPNWHHTACAKPWKCGERAINSDARTLRTLPRLIILLYHCCLSFGCKRKENKL
jgi:hypothetical protein